MTERVGERLREQRCALGLSLEQVSEGTGVPRDYLEALEAGESRRLPPGPYATAYVRTYRLFLGRFARRAAETPGERPSLTIEPTTTGGMFPSSSVPTPTGEDGPALTAPVVRQRPLPTTVREPEPKVPLPLVRALALAAVLLFAGVLLWQIVDEMQQSFAHEAQVVPRTITVKLQLQRNASLVVWVDGTKRAERLFEGSEEVEFTANERIVVEIPSIEAVRVWFDGRRVSPLGRKGLPRRLTFVADDEGQG